MELSADPVTKGLGKQGSWEHHTHPDFSDVDRRTSVPSGLGFCFLCFLLRGNSTANFIFSSLQAMRPLTQGPSVAPDRHRLGSGQMPRSSSQPLPSPVPSVPGLQMRLPFSQGEDSWWGGRTLDVDSRPLASATALPQTCILQVTGHLSFSFLAYTRGKTSSGKIGFYRISY